ncbi:MAG: hypothetical protein E7339_06945 [Clostridiales bacterium]|nr:hypothetical protein [Clostridiales bacterium]
MRKFSGILLLLVMIVTMCFSTFACDNGTNSSGNDSSSGSIGGESTTQSTLEDKSLYLGMYGVLPKKYQPTIPDFEQSVNDDQFNVFNIGIMSDQEMDYYCQMIYDAGKKFWLQMQDYVWQFTVNGPELREDCYKQLYMLRERFAGKPWYDALLGWHIDEPLLQRMPVNVLYEGSKAIHEVFPEKRFWVNFAGFAFNEDLSGWGDHMNREAGKYITDISFDLYGNMNETIYETWNNMVEMFEGEDKYFWAVPMCMSYASRTDEAGAIEHLEEFYRLIKETKGGCGIMLYSGITYSWEIEQIGNIGYYDLQVSVEEFKTWKSRKKPWSSYYDRFYDKNGNPINGGFKPWTNLAAKIDEVAASMKAYNDANVTKMETEIVIEQNAVFEYNGMPQKPKVYPDYLNYEYKFLEKATEIISDEAPIAVGEYEMIVTLKESAFRKGATAKATFTIKQTNKTLILDSEIVEDYSSDRFYVTVKRSNLKYSFDNINYVDYVANSKIDVTEYVVRSQYVNHLYFKEGDKEPYVLPIKTYQEKVVFNFEGATSAPASQYSLVANKQYAGKQAAYCDSERGTEYDTGRIYNFYFSDSLLPNAASGPDLSDAKYLEMWIYAEEDIDSIVLAFAVTGWAANSCLDSYSVKAGEWTRLVFNLTNMSRPDLALDAIIVFTLTVNNNANFYLDHVVAISL